MKVVLHRTAPAPVSFEQFAVFHRLELHCFERSKTIQPDDRGRWYAHFRSCEVKQGNMLSGTYGEGPDPNAAIDDYAKILRGRLLVVNAYSPDRREIQCPAEWEPSKPGSRSFQ